MSMPGDGIQRVEEKALQEQPDIRPGGDDTWSKVRDVMRQEMSTPEEILEDLDTTEKGNVRQTIENCMRVFYRDPVLKDAVRKNELTGKIDIVKDIGWKRGCYPGITDTDIFQIERYLENTYKLTNDRVINKAVSIIASEKSYHPIRDYLESLRWDGQERIRQVLPKYLGVDENAYTEEIMTLLLMAAIKRIYEPGCKYEIMVCLVGGQGAGKSTFFRFLALRDEWFSDDLKKIDDEMVYRKMAGHWIIEMSEMLGTVTARSIEDIKSFLSRQKETYKVPYEVHPEDRPRQCIFVGTSNNLDFLPLDRTGNRRFAPILVHPERVEKHILEDEAEARAYIRQVWAEAMALYKKTDKHELRLKKETEAHLAEIQKDYMQDDAKEGIIQEWLDSYEGDYVCSVMIFKEVFSNDREEPKQWELREIGKIMNYSVRGWERVTNHRFEKYGTQRSWKRITDKEDFSPVPESRRTPFT